MYNCKKVACKREYINKMLFIEKPFRCGLDQCKGAHTYNELTINSEVSKFDKTDWKTINFKELYKTIYLQIKSSISNFNKYTELSLDKPLNQLNFVELLDFWRKFAIIMRREKKNFYEKTSRAKSFGFKNPGDIPTLDLGELDGFAWSLWRSFHNCEDHENFLKSVKSGMSKYDLQKTVCFHSINCKNGTHHKNRQICSDNLLYGKCECLSRTVSNKKISNLNSNLKKITQRINKMVKYSIPKIENCDAKLKVLLLDFRNKIVEIEKTQSKIHLTEFGVIPIHPIIEELKKTFLKPRNILIFKEDDITTLQKLTIVRGRFQF